MQVPHIASGPTTVALPTPEFPKPAFPFAFGVKEEIKRLRAHRQRRATRELVAMGDFNMPKIQPGDPIFDALTRLGLEIPNHSTQIASSIASDANYHQVAFFPGTTRNCFTGRKGVFDFDTVVFPTLWQDGANGKDFKAYLRYYLSDHRPMWVELAY